MENSTCKIVKNTKSDLVFTPGTKESKDGKSYGFYIVEQVSTSIQDGFIREDKRSAIITVENGLGARLAYAEGKEMSGKIIRSEVTSDEPILGFQAVVNPETKEPVLRGGKQLYRKDMFTSNLDAVDSLVARDVVAIAETAKAESSMAN